MCRKEGLLLLLNPGPGLSAGRSDVTNWFWDPALSWKHR